MSTLRGTKSFYDYDITDTMSHNVRSWLDHGLLELGAYTLAKFNLPTSGLTNLQGVKDERYSDNVIYEGMGPSWVWEENIEIIPSGVSQPFQASGVHVNSVFYPTATTSGTYAHSLDFQTGRVIFDSAIPSADVVKCEYTFRDVGVYLTDSPQWKIIVDEYQVKFENLNTLSPSGMASILKEKRVWLPSVFIETQDSTHRGLQLGGGQFADVTVMYHIFADRPFANNRLSDVINNQEALTLNLYDINTAPFPYNFDGSLNPSGLKYTDLSKRSSTHFWTFGYIASSAGGPKTTMMDIYRAEIIQRIEVSRYLSTF